jgi:lactate dehydrogenase-like 2-hydroxyacid dehydrogenase
LIIASDPNLWYHTRSPIQKGTNSAKEPAMRDLPRVYVTRRLPQPALDLLARHAQVAVWPGETPPPRAVLMKELADADGLLALVGDHVDAALMDAAPRLRVIGNYALGSDNIDVVAATRRGILVTHTPDVLTETTADFALALMLAAARRVIEAEQYVRAGRWRAWGPETLLGRDVYGATLGIVGLGRVGQAVARRARGFGMRVLYTGPARKPDAEQQIGASYVELEELLAQSDVVSLHCPLTDETYHLIDREALARMRPDALLVNTARGPIVDTRALVEALRGRPMVAALDVTDPEPLPPDHALLALPNAIVTPHVASASVRTRTRMALMAVEGLVAALQGERPPYLVNAEAWPEKVVQIGEV